MIPVTRISINASQDDLTEDDYRDIYNELRVGVSLSAFGTAINSQFSKARWSNYETGKQELNRTMRSELRRAVALPPLPPTLHEVMDDVNPDAEVVRLGNQVVNRVILTGHTGRLNLSLNGAVVADMPNAGNARVTPVTRRHDRRFRPTVSQENRAWLEGQGLSADQAIDLAKNQIGGR